ncbi:site-specific DNA-methyltransferase [bacterium]|nr:site-specific DNA-methyltransferase [bacterium]
MEWMRTIFDKVYQKTKSGGRCIINIGDGKNGEVPTHVDITNFMLDIGWSYYTTIIWHKSQIGSRTAWGSFKSPSCPSFPTPFEFILVFYKESKKIQWKGESDLESKEFIDLSNSLWNFTPEVNMKKMGHPAAFPLELPRRCIKMFSWVDSIVYDPFMGVGTTALACKLLNRKWIGSEISSEYFKTSMERLS